LFDSMIWGELGAALPAAGGSYHFLLESYGRHRWGRLMAFLFVWQILISGPLEIGSGLVAAAQFSTAFGNVKKFDEKYTRKVEIMIADADDPADRMTVGVAFVPTRLFGFALGVAIIALLYRRVTTLGKLSVVFLVGVFAVLIWVIIEGALRFDSSTAFDVTVSDSERPKSWGLALGAGMALAIFSYFGYYNICYLGAEVRNPARTIPKTILLSAVVVVILFSLTHLAF